MKNTFLRAVLVFILFCLSIQLFFITLDLLADDTTVTRISSRFYNYLNQ